MLGFDDSSDDGNEDINEMTDAQWEQIGQRYRPLNEGIGFWGGVALVGLGVVGGLMLASRNDGDDKELALEKEQAKARELRRQAQILALHAAKFRTGNCAQQFPIDTNFKATVDQLNNAGQIDCAARIIANAPRGVEALIIAYTMPNANVAGAQRFIEQAQALRPDGLEQEDARIKPTASKPK